jgi:hypothetical protein
MYHVDPRAEKKNSCRFSAEKPDRKRLLRRPKFKCECMNLNEGGCVGVDYMHLGRSKGKW